MKSIALALTALALCLGGFAAEGLHGAGGVQPARSAGPGLQSSDLPRLRSVADVHLSPDATRVAYSIVNSDRPGRPYSQVWIMNVATRQSSRLGPADGAASSPRWSPDGRSIA